MCIYIYNTLSVPILVVRSAVSSFLIESLLDKQNAKIE